MPRLSVEQRSEMSQENAADAWPRDLLRYKNAFTTFRRAHVKHAVSDTISGIVRKRLISINKTTCFHQQNNLFSSTKQLIFISKTSYFPQLAKLF